MTAPPADRQSLVALWIVAPAIVAALFVLGLEGYRRARPDAPIFAPPAAASLADAIQQQELEAAYAFIHAGQDPNAPMPVQDAGLTGGRVTMVSPVMLAVASRNANAVLMLLSAGARMDLPQNRLALCLAREIGDEEIGEMLADVADTTIECPEHAFPN